MLSAIRHWVRRFFQTAFGISTLGNRRSGLAGSSYPIPAMESRILLSFGPDLSFATTGWAAYDFGQGGGDYISDIAVTQSNKIVAVGTVVGGAYDSFVVGRVLSNGQIDQTFGVNGRREFHFTSAIPSLGIPVLHLDSEAHAVTTQGDGKLIVVGKAGDYFGVARLHSNGQLDSSFGGDLYGVAGTKLVIVGSGSAEANAVSIDANGKIVVAGFIDPPNGGRQFAVARLNSDGSADGTFGSLGRVTTAVGSDAFATSLAIQSDGKILVAGTSRSNDGQLVIAVVRYLSNGLLDADFANGGRSSVRFDSSSSNECNRVLIQPDGRILVAGTSRVGSATYGIARLRSDGFLDTSFGANGYATFDLGLASNLGDMELQADGRIILSGKVSYGEGLRTGVLRLESDGTRDYSFGTIVSDHVSRDILAPMAISTDGSIVVGTSTYSIGPTRDSVISKYSQESSPLSFLSGHTFAVEENTTSIATLTATGPVGSNLTYSMIPGPDSDLFTINTTTGELSFITAPDFEAPVDAGADNVYDLMVRVSDGVHPAVTHAIAVSVNDIGEPPRFDTGPVIQSDENSNLIGNVIATDPEGTPVSFVIAGGADAGMFQIDSLTGELTFLAAPNYESPADSNQDNLYEVTIAISDGVFSAVSRTFFVSIVNVDEAPVMTSPTQVRVDENTSIASILTATDSESGLLVFSIVGGDDHAKFEINPNTGELLFITSPDFESPSDSNGDNTYEVAVGVHDGVNSAIPLAISVSVDDVVEATYTFSGGRLTVVGTETRHDTIAVLNDGGTIKIVAEGATIETGVLASDVTAVSLSGLGGNDTLKLDASLGATVLGTILGGDGDDLLFSGIGNDLIQGGNGIDEVSYIQAVSGVNINLTTVVSQYSLGAGIDRLIEIENLTGSNFNDHLTGNAVANLIIGGLGNDAIGGNAGADTLIGGEGNDSVTFDNNDAAISGGSGVDTATVAGATGGVYLDLAASEIETVVATSSMFSNLFDATNATWSVRITGGSGSDWISGGSLNDTLSGGAGSDTLIGLSGNDNFTIDNFDIAIYGGLGVDVLGIAGATGPVILNLTNSEIESVNASASTFDNYFDATGATWSVSVQGGMGNDTIVGGESNDGLMGGAGNDQIFGGGGNDTLKGQTGTDQLYGEEGGDTLHFDNWDTIVLGGIGIDGAFVTGETGSVTFNLTVNEIENASASTSVYDHVFDARGATWNVGITCGNGNDTAYGGLGHDTLLGNGGNDVLIGGAGNDAIGGGTGFDYLQGEEGNDGLTFDNLDVVVDGGLGVDLANLVGATGPVSFNLVTSSVDTVIATTSTFNNTFDATGATWVTRITCGSGDDTIYGGLLTDTIFGGLGNDVLVGGAGNDVLIGEAGADEMHGGDGNDSLRFDNFDSVIQGGQGIDNAYLVNPTGPLYFNLVSNGFETVDASPSTFNNIFDASGASWVVRITGGSGDDIIHGGLLGDTLDGRAGNDYLSGGLGNDLIKGGTGSDTVSYASSTGGVTVNLLTNRATGGAGTDTLDTIENVLGSAFADTITGNAFDNILDGGDGLDIIIGGGGNDTILNA